MADFSFNASAALRNESRQFDAIELSAVPRSRAPSYRSTEPSLFRADDDNESLLKHAAPTAYSPVPKQDPIVRVESKTPTVSREQRRRLSGWRFGVTVAAWTAFIVMMVNLISLIAIAGKFHGSIHGGVATIYEGSCGTADTWATGLHIVINALSSILLSASNYTMQVLCSPTRGEIDRAHARGDWMDIGVASVRNIMGRVAKRRILLWWVLGLSSVPVHLLYNSVVFKTIDSNIYDIMVVNTDFLKGENFSMKFDYVNTNTPFYNYEAGSGSEGSDYDELRSIQSFFTNNSGNSSAVERLENADCMTAYGTQYTTGRQNVLAITSARGNATNQTMFFNTDTSNVDEQGLSGNIGLLSYAWICMDMPQGLSSKGDNEHCDIPSARRNATSWTLNGRKIDYCLSQVEPSHCKLEASTTILAVIIAMNAAKAFAMFWTVFMQKEATLVTVGDSVTSFLEHPDELTKGRCLMAKVDVSQGPLRWKRHGAKGPHTQPLPVTYHAALRRRWYSAASKTRWAVTISLCIAALITAGGLLGAGVSYAASYVGGTAAAFAMGFGKIDSRTLIDAGLPQSGASGLVSSVLLANLPQAICSFIYLTYNGLFTSMLGAAEWSRYFRRKKALRVTTPRGVNQRSTYYLQLPYKYSLPLLLTSGTLHWLISESIFLARIDVWQDDQLVPNQSTSQVGYSCLPILLVILLGVAMLVAAIANGFRKLYSPMPVAGSCSVAISAACQRPAGDVDAAFQPVSWGDVKQEDSDIRHCCFSSYDTDDLIIGSVYAGQDTRPVEMGNDEDGRHTARRRRI